MISQTGLWSEMGGGHRSFSRVHRILCRRLVFLTAMVDLGP